MPQGQGSNYVSRWESPGSPQPFLCKGMTGYGFVLEGRRENLDALCQRYLTQPSDGAVDYRPVSHYVLLTFTYSNFLAPRDQPYRNMGHMPEMEAALWILTAAVERKAGHLVAERLAWFIPYIFVDNPVAMTAGREIFGYAKESGWLEMPIHNEQPERLAADAICVKHFAPDAEAKRQLLIEVERTGLGVGAGLSLVWNTIEGAIGYIRRLLFDNAALVLPGVQLAEDLLHTASSRQVSQVFLKQLYDPADGTRACYQAIVEAPVELTFRNAGVLTARYQVALHRYDSHPIHTDLGLQEQQTPKLGYWLDWDFTLLPGRTVWARTAS